MRPFGTCRPPILCEIGIFSILFNRKIRKALHNSDVFVPIQVILSEIFETPVSKRGKLVVKEMVKNSVREILLEIKEKRPT